MELELGVEAYRDLKRCCQGFRGRLRADLTVPLVLKKSVQHLVVDQRGRNKDAALLEPLIPERLYSLIVWIYKESNY